MALNDSVYATTVFIFYIFWKSKENDGIAQQRGKENISLNILMPVPSCNLQAILPKSELFFFFKL